MNEGLTYTEAKKIVKDWRKDFACNVSEGYIISAFLDDAFIIKKLRADLAAANARAEAAEAALAAVPVDALRQLRTHLSNDGDYSITRTDGEQMWIGDSLVLGSLFEKIDAWLAQQSEAQP